MKLQQIKMNPKIIFVLSAFLACSYADTTKDCVFTFSDESTGNLKGESKMTVTVSKPDHLHHVEMSDMKFIAKENVDPETVFPPFKWMLEEPLKDLTFDFTHSRNGSFSVTTPEDIHPSAKILANILVETIAQGKLIESYYAKGEKPEKKKARTVFGLCEVKNMKEVNQGTDLVLTFDVDKDDCINREKGYITEPKPDDQLSMTYVFADGVEMVGFICEFHYELDGVTHNVEFSMKHIQMHA